jgi:hypothetical protein
VSVVLDDRKAERAKVIVYVLQGAALRCVALYYGFL